METLLDTVNGIATGFLAQLPLVILALVVLAVALAVARAVETAVRRALASRDPALARMIGLLARAIVTICGILAALWIALPTVRFTDVFASLGVTGLILGFALRDIIENFVAGVLILWRQPFVVGDQIRSGDYEGRVEEVNFRSTVLQTYDGIRVLIPNGRVFTEPVENRTANELVRTEVALGIDQSASVGRARAAILAALRDEPGVLDDPAPTVLLDSIGDFANNLRVLFWTRPPTRFSELVARSQVTEQLIDALQAAGIGFPFPTRTVRLQDPEPLAVRILPNRDGSAA